MNQNKLYKMDTIKQDEYLHEVDVIRAFAATLVVFFHAYNMMYASVHFPDTVEVYGMKYYWFNSICMWFHMPIFIFISGGVYGYLYTSKGKYRKLLPFIKNKAKRLLLPYMVFAIVFMLTSNSWSLQGLYSGAYSHLWFLSMLFWCFAFACIVNRIYIMQRWWAQLLLLTISFVFLCDGRCMGKIAGIHNLYRWFFWFYLGFVVYSYKTTVLDLLKRWVAVPLLFPVIYCLCMWYMVSVVGRYDYDVKCVISEIGFLTVVIWLWYIICRGMDAFGKGWTQCKLIKELSACSFGIYIFHNWIEPYMISRTAQKLLPLADWAAEHTVLFPLVFSLLALLISYILTKIVLLTKLGRALIG